MRWGTLALILLVSACSSDSNSSTTSPTTTSSGIFVTELFTGNLNVMGSAIYYPPGFTVVTQNAVSITLVSLSTGPRTPALVVPVALGVGTPNAAGGCDLTTSVVTVPGLVEQITTAPLAPATYLR